MDFNQNYYNLGAGDSTKIEENLWPRLRTQYDYFLYESSLIQSGINIKSEEICLLAHDLRRQIVRILQNYAGMESNAYITQYKDLESMQYILDISEHNVQLVYSTLTGANMLTGFQVMFVNTSTQNIMYDETAPMNLEIRFILSGGTEYSENFPITESIYVGESKLFDFSVSQIPTNPIQVRYILTKTVEGVTTTYCDTTLAYRSGDN